MAESRPLVRVAGHLLNTPLACTVQHASLIVAALRSELNIDLLQSVEGPRLDRAGMDRMASDGRLAADTRNARHAETSKIFDQDQGVAIIPITGTLTKTWGLDPYSGMTGYDGIKQKLFAAMEDDSVEAILLDIDSPGGAVSGCFDLVDTIFACNERNGGKLIYALANETACSAAYAIMSAADERFVPRTGTIGSVGVLMIHTDVRGSLAQDGVVATIFRAGTHKAEGNSLEPLEADTIERIQESLDEARTLFIDTVARNLDAKGTRFSALQKSVRETEALTYIGEHARAVGFATAIASDDQVWMRLMRRLGR